ncbi:MAG: ATP-binding cassette domain-containing protein [Vampirovibrionales bacterium]
MALVVEGLHKRYGGRPVVNGVSFDVNPGEIVGLLGPNGAGKTTSFYSVLGIIRPDAGAVFVDERDISNLPIHERAQAGVGYLPQETSVFRRLTVEENLRLVQEFQPDSKEDKEEQLEGLLTEFGLQKHRKSLAIQLSGGERRRTEIARAIAAKPDFCCWMNPLPVSTLWPSRTSSDWYSNSRIAAWAFC